MRVRRALVEDAPGIAEVNALGWKQGYRGVLPDALLDEYDGRPEQRREQLENPAANSVQLVAVEGDHVVGWIAGRPAEDRGGNEHTRIFEVGACYVHPSHWRCGVGRSLIEALLLEVSSQWSMVSLWTLEDTPRSRNFYVSLGFVVDGSKPYGDTGVRCVRMSRAL